MKKVMIAAAASGSGKTTITLGLMALLKKQGQIVQPYKVGPDYVDTEYHTRITGRPSRNLDMFLVQERSRLRELFAKEAQQADICIIEGVMGLFDGLGVDKDYCSSAGVAKELNCPVILVVDGKSASTSVAAVVKGFLDFDDELEIIGVIVNKVASENHFQLIKKAIETYTNTKVFGYLQKNSGVELPSRQLGLVPDREISDVLEKVNQVADALSETVEVAEILALLPEEKLDYQAPSYPDFSDVTIAYASDEAFHFYYPDNLELLQAYGVTLKEFSTLRDKNLPEADLYYFGGGYPEEFAEQLAANDSMKQAVLKKHQEKIPILAECGGLMYLGESLVTDAGEFSMVGIFQGYSQMTKGLKRFGYSIGEALCDTLICSKGEKVVGHEFHHSEFNSEEDYVLKMTKERDGDIVSRWSGGFQKEQTFASYLHLHFYQSTDFLENLLQNIRESRPAYG